MGVNSFSDLLRQRAWSKIAKTLLVNCQNESELEDCLLLILSKGTVLGPAKHLSQLISNSEKEIPIFLTLFLAETNARFGLLDISELDELRNSKEYQENVDAYLWLNAIDSEHHSCNGSPTGLKNARQILALSAQPQSKIGIMAYSRLKRIDMMARQIARQISEFELASCSKEVINGFYYAGVIEEIVITQVLINLVNGTSPIGDKDRFKAALLQSITELQILGSDRLFYAYLALALLCITDWEFEPAKRFVKSSRKLVKAYLNPAFLHLLEVIELLIALQSGARTPDLHELVRIFAVAADFMGISKQITLLASEVLMDSGEYELATSFLRYVEPTQVANTEESWTTKSQTIARLKLIKNPCEKSLSSALQFVNLWESLGAPANANKLRLSICADLERIGRGDLASGVQPNEGENLSTFRPLAYWERFLLASYSMDEIDKNTLKVLTPTLEIQLTGKQTSLSLSLRKLLAFLVLNSGRIEQQILQQLMWPGILNKDSLSRLKVTIARLNNKLRDTGGAFIKIKCGVVNLELDSNLWQVDLYDFYERLSGNDQNKLDLFSYFDISMLEAEFPNDGFITASREHVRSMWVENTKYLVSRGLINLESAYWKASVMGVNPEMIAEGHYGTSTSLSPK